jgi:hypothetical protein
MSEEDWISFYTAAREIAERLGMSQAVARKHLRQACADQLITTMKRPLDPEPMPIEFWTRIDPREWSTRTVDYDPPDTDGSKTEVIIHEDDFRSWIEQRSAPQSNREAAITKRLRAGVPGKDLPWKRFCDDVRKDCRASLTTRGFTNETIEDITREIMKGHK